MIKLIIALLQKNTYEYLGGDWLKVEHFALNTYKRYKGIKKKLYIFLINKFWEKCIPYIEPNSNIYDFFKYYLNYKVNKKNFIHYIYPFLLNDCHFYTAYNNRNYLSDRQKLNYIINLLQEQDIFYLVVIMDIKDKKIKNNAEMLLALFKCC